MIMHDNVYVTMDKVPYDKVDTSSSDSHETKLTSITPCVRIR